MAKTLSMLFSFLKRYGIREPINNARKLALTITITFEVRGKYWIGPIMLPTIENSQRREVSDKGCHNVLKRVLKARKKTSIIITSKMLYESII